jgi:hypothetical protein
LGALGGCPAHPPSGPALDGTSTQRLEGRRPTACPPVSAPVQLQIVEAASRSGPDRPRTWARQRSENQRIVEGRRFRGRQRVYLSAVPGLRHPPSGLKKCSCFSKNHRNSVGPTRTEFKNHQFLEFKFKITKYVKLCKKLDQIVKALVEKSFQVSTILLDKI